MTTLDFDKGGRLVGIRVVGTSKKMTPEIIKNAEILSED